MLPYIAYMDPMGYDYACGPKTVLVKRTFWGWGGVGWGGHVNVPCTSCIIMCYAAKICGIVATLLVSLLRYFSLQR